MVNNNDSIKKNQCFGSRRKRETQEKVRSLKIPIKNINYFPEYFLSIITNKDIKVFKHKKLLHLPSIETNLFSFENKTIC